MKKTIFLDIDGCILEHGGTIYTQLSNKIKPLPSVSKRLHEWERDGHKIILTTARKECFRETTVKQLRDNHIIYDLLIMGINRGERIVINDRKPNELIKTCNHYELTRNMGLGSVILSEKLGFLAGTFDVMHPGYIKMLKETKKHCGTLVVGLHAKNPNKPSPILSVEDRTEMLLSNENVDYVMMYETESDLIELLKQIKPDIRFLGDDYKNKSFTGDKLHIDIMFIDRTHGWSTTQYKKLIVNEFK